MSNAQVTVNITSAQEQEVLLQEKKGKNTVLLLLDFQNYS